MDKNLEQDLIKEGFSLLDDALARFQEIDTNPIAQLIAGIIYAIIKHFGDEVEVK